MFGLSKDELTNLVRKTIASAAFELDYETWFQTAVKHTIIRETKEKPPTIKIMSPTWEKKEEHHFHISLGGGIRKYDDVHATEIPLAEAIQLLIDHLDLRYQPEVTDTSPARLVKKARAKKGKA